MNFDDLVVSRLVHMRRHDTLPLTLFKYHRRVFYRGLFETDDRLRWARGIVLNDKSQIVVRPFYKLYNYTENDAGKDWNDSDSVVIMQKRNGFMMCVTHHEEYGLLYTTTGSFNSEYVSLGKFVIEKYVDLNALRMNHTYIFEVCHSCDPHIIHEPFELFLIACHGESTDDYRIGKNREICVFDLRETAKKIAARSSAPIGVDEMKTVTFGDAKKLCKEAKHEGFMVYNARTDVTENGIKLKTPYYLTTKFIARNKQKIFHKTGEINRKAAYRLLDEEFYSFIDYLFENGIRLGLMSEQERIAQIRSFMES